ncbi:hypothetical protein JKP88DRAFT_272578 [Tribonema minus]|uniref:Uncharacterized protein n=1 Tax=Tribonema minus TaxID=303371 RepID=A0A835Z531_9STRA|nr:hypothetical protein JKP88DRAFT_272578 [Tribonema minus]
MFKRPNPIASSKNKAMAIALRVGLAAAMSVIDADMEGQEEDQHDVARPTMSKRAKLWGQPPTPLPVVSPPAEQEEQKADGEADESMLDVPPSGTPGAETEGISNPISRPATPLPLNSSVADSKLATPIIPEATAPVIAPVEPAPIAESRPATPLPVPEATAPIAQSRPATPLPEAAAADVHHQLLG